MIELPGWNDLISVNGFCYSSSMGESPKLNIPLKTSTAPTKGIAPDTFNRNSIATYIEDGLVKTAGIDVIRFQNGRYLCELAATNNFTYSGDMSLDITDASNLVSDPLYPGPFSNINANLVDLTSGAQYIYKTMSLVAGTYCFSQYVKLGTAPSVGYGIYSVTTAAWVVEQTRYTGLSALEYKRVNVVFTLATNQTIRIYLKRYIDAATLGTSYHFGGQVETGTQATSYIPTTSAPVTRAADVLHYAVGDVITQGQGSLYCEFWNGNYAGTVRRILNISDGTNSNRLYPYLKDTGGVALFGFTAGVASISVGTVSASSTLNKLLVSYETNSVKLYVNGVLVGTNTGCIIPVGLSKLHIGVSEAGTYVLNSEIGNIKYFREVLTPAEAIKITTL